MLSIVEERLQPEALFARVGVRRVRGEAVTREQYYRDQGRLLLSLALLSHDSEYAAHLVGAGTSPTSLWQMTPPSSLDLAPLLEEFNQQQMLKG